MTNSIRNLEPKALWNHFADLNEVPRPSKKEERVIHFMKAFGEQLGLFTHVDETGNVLIKKPGTTGREDRPAVALQSHLDMVHQRNADTDFDFDTQGINMFVESDWVRARGTTLGADNGIGVAAIMAILAADDLPHPPIEALFTIDEETGMTGAKGLKEGLLDAQFLLNLDTEDEDELTIGCAGGLDVTATGQYHPAKTPADIAAYRIGVRGLTGGHSGMDIHLGRANANKLVNRVLYGAGEFGLRVSAIDGGGLRNAIPRESFATVVVPVNVSGRFREYLKAQEDLFRSEYTMTDPELAVVFEEAPPPHYVLDDAFQWKLLRATYACPNGIFRMSPAIKGLVQTSNNLARVLVADGKFTVMCLTRSSVDSEKMDLASAIKAVFELAGGAVEFGGGYPGWTPKPEASIVKLMSGLYRTMFESEPKVSACHAGLECGILGTNYPDVEMISFGPNIRGAHSPDEAVQVSSVQRFWKFLLKTLDEV